MPGFGFLLIAAAVIAVAAVLVMGLLSFTRDGAEARGRSNRLMQWRIGLQFAALAIIVALVALS